MAQSHMHATHHISNLIAELEKIRAKHGDLPIVYWDQQSVCTWDKPDGMLIVSDSHSHLYLGGIHVNGSLFCSKDPSVSEDPERGECDFEEEEEEEEKKESNAANQQVEPAQQ